MTRRRTEKMACSVLGALAAALLLLSARPASAQVTYWYNPGHPMNWKASRVPNACTGGFGVRLWNGQARFLTAGHCFALGNTIFGTDGPFAQVTDNPHGQLDGLDTLLALPYPNTDGLQIIANHGSRVVGLLHNDRFQVGSPVCMLGISSGLVCGTVTGWQRWTNGELVVCTTYPRQGGDSGGPVFTHDGHGQAWAAGLHVGTLNGAGGCFIAIDTILSYFGATLPVFPSTNRAAVQAAPSPDADRPPLQLPELPPGEIQPD